MVTPLLDGAVQVSGVDVRLGNRFVVFQRSAVSSFDPIGEADDPRSLQRVVARHWGDHFVLHPGELVLASTLEYVRLPEDLSAQVITRSSYGRLGLITATAVQVNPHYRGCLTLELVNLGEVPVRLMPAERIAQLVFLRVDPSEAPEEQKYDYSVGPRFSSVRDDPEVDVLRRMRERLGDARTDT